METYEQLFEKYKAAFDAALADYLSKITLAPDILNESFRYSLLVGGKRLRPVLMFAAARMLGGKEQDVAPFAVALEMIHTYSLVHDDLPGMDNGDCRRGQPSNHRKFGGGQAILAGDALLNEAYALCFQESRRGRTYLNAAEQICLNAGARGMIAGQAADLFYEGREDAGRSEAEFIVRNKTAKMLVSAVTVPAYVYGMDENIISLLAEYGRNLGFLFQITDDMLDVNGEFDKLGKSVGKDESEKKLSFVRLCGMEECRALAERYCAQCEKVLDVLPFETEFFKETARFVLNREY